MKLKKILIGGIAAALLVTILVTAFASGGTGITGITGRENGSCGMFQGGCCSAGRISGTGVTGAAQESTATQADGVQEIATTLEPYGYPELTVQMGMPVKWTITVDAQNLNFCNNEIIIPAYGISKKLSAGENIIEFTPADAGVIPYSCWMGMIRSTITVVE